MESDNKESEYSVSFGREAVCVALAIRLAVISLGEKYLAHNDEGEYFWAAQLEQERLVRVVVQSAHLVIMSDN